MTDAQALATLSGHKAEIVLAKLGPIPTVQAVCSCGKFKTAQYAGPKAKLTAMKFFHAHSVEAITREQEVRHAPAQ